MPVDRKSFQTVGARPRNRQTRTARPSPGCFVILDGGAAQALDGSTRIHFAASERRLLNSLLSSLVIDFERFPLWKFEFAIIAKLGVAHNSELNFVLIASRRNFCFDSYFSSRRPVRVCKPIRCCPPRVVQPSADRAYSPDNHLDGS